MTTLSESGVQREFLHMLKADVVERFFKEKLSYMQKDKTALCVIHCPPRSDFFHLVERLKLCLDFLECGEHMPSNFIGHLRDFKKHSELTKFFFAWFKDIKKEIQGKLDLFSCEECKRLGEAIHTFEEQCFFSSVILAVSAIESRLHYILKKKDKKLYAEHFEKASFGALISLFGPDKYKDTKFLKFKNIVSDKHKPLLSLCNKYKIFSSHPKDEDIERNLALSILCLSFAFLLDPDLKIQDKNVTKHVKNKL